MFVYNCLEKIELNEEYYNSYFNNNNFKKYEILQSELLTLNYIKNSNIHIMSDWNNSVCCYDIKNHKIFDIRDSDWELVLGYKFLNNEKSKQQFYIFEILCEMSSRGYTLEERRKYKLKQDLFNIIYMCDNKER